MPDIDVDFPPSRRQEVIDYVASLEGINFAEIITLNTVALKGAIREVGRGLEMPLDEVDAIAKSVIKVGQKFTIDKSWREKYPELFKHVDILDGVVISIGSHPSGFIVSPINLEDNVSTIYTKNSKYPVTSINMKELDGLQFIKLDILGLDNIELINETCKLIGIERLTPDNIDIDDIDVWKSLRESTLGVFQFESTTAHDYLKQLFSDETLENIRKNVGEISYIDLLSMANGAIRPAGESYRQQLAKGIPKDNGHEALNKFLRSTLSYLIYQEQIMQFLMEFCNHTGAEADTVRRGLAKKIGTQQYLPKIREGFISFMKEKYGESEEHAEKILESFLKVIDDAKDYGFSLNHSQPYSYIGYICAYLRYHYPLEFLTVLLNIQDDDQDKTAEIVKYAKSRGIEIKPISFGKSRAIYSFDRKENAIYKGIASIKFLNKKVAEELYELSQSKEYDHNNFTSLLIDIIEHTSVDSRQLKILIMLDYFKQFGDKGILLEIFKVVNGEKKVDIELYPQFKKISEKGKVGIKPLKYTKTLKEKSKSERIKNIKEYEEVLRNESANGIERYKINIIEQIQFEKDVLGYAITTYPDLSKKIALILDIDKKYTPRLTLYIFKTGQEISVKVPKKKFYTETDQLLYVGDVIKITNIEERNGGRYVDGKWVEDETKKVLFLNKCKILRRNKVMDSKI